MVRWLSISMITAVCTPGVIAHAQSTQRFHVTVPPSASVSAPTTAILTHDQTNADQVFPAQLWTVRGNARAGILVTFETVTAFKHSTEPEFSRDLALELGIDSSEGPAAWTIAQSSDQTNYRDGAGTATVQAMSDSAGTAVISLRIRFLTDSFDSCTAGEYETAVIGTVAAN